MIIVVFVTKIPFLKCLNYLDILSKTILKPYQLITQQVETQKTSFNEMAVDIDPESLTIILWCMMILYRSGCFDSLSTVSPGRLRYITMLSF